MQISAYNTFLESTRGEKLAFNNISGRILPVNNQIVDYLKGSATARPGPFKLKQLYDAGFLVPDRQKEMELISGNLKRIRNNTDVLQYTLVMTYLCNLSCPYCYEDSLKERSGSMTEEIAQKTIEHIKNQLVNYQAKKLSITLYGGEPLLNFKVCLFTLQKAHQYCEQNGIGFVGSLITNGVLLDDAKIGKLSRYIRLTQVTLEGGKDYHDRIRLAAGSKKTFATIVNSIKKLVEAGILVNIRIQVSPDSIDSLEDCFEQLDKHGLLNHSGTNCYFFPIMNIGGVCSSKSFSCAERYYDSEMFRELWGYASRFPVTAAPQPAPAWVAPYCSFVNKGAWIVDPKGLKYKCVSMIGKPEGQCGDVFDLENNENRESFMQRALQFTQRSGVSIEECRNCEHLPICDGGCAYLAKESSGRMESSYCDMHKNSIKDHLRQIYEKRER